MTKKQLCINFLSSILELYEFDLYTEKNDDGELVLKLSDLQGGNLGNLEGDEFYNLGDVVSRLDIYHDDYIYEPLLDLGYEWENQDELMKIEATENEGDWDLTVAKFLGSDNIADILISITPEYYKKYLDKIKDDGGRARKKYNYKDIKKYL